MNDLHLLTYPASELQRTATQPLQLGVQVSFDLTKEQVPIFVFAYSCENWVFYCKMLNSCLSVDVGWALTELPKAWEQMVIAYQDLCDSPYLSRRVKKLNRLAFKKAKSRGRRWIRRAERSKS